MILINEAPLCISVTESAHTIALLYVNGNPTLKIEVSISFLLFLSQSPKRNGGQGKERFSGLWEFFYDSDESGNGGGGEGEREVERREVGEGGKLKNIRGFLFKRRKSPLKGWHKVG